MTNNKKKINKLFTIKKNLIKNMFKITILKSIIQSKNVKPITRSYASFKLTFLNKNNLNNVSSLKNVCFYTNKIKSTSKKFHFSRYMIKNFSILNKLQNIKQFIKN
jgi:hypothetical protein